MKPKMTSVQSVNLGKMKVILVVPLTLRTLISGPTLIPFRQF